MRIIVTADIHNGYPGRLRDTIWAMRKMSKFARENDCEKVIVLGDMFHNRDHITIDVLNSVFDFFESVEEEWIIFPGNHDMFMKVGWDVNSVRPLKAHANVINDISRFSLDGRGFVVVPFMHYESEYMDIIRHLESRYDENDVILTHIGVNNAVSNSCFLLKNWSAVNFASSKFNLVLTGHYHNYQVIDDKVCYPGSPIPFKFDEGMVPHGFLLMDTDTLQVNLVDFRDICDDRPYDFVTITDDMLDEMKESGDFSSLKGNKVRVALNREYSESELESIKECVVDNGSLSVGWMKRADEEVVYGNLAVDTSKPIFNQWLETQSLDKYDLEVLFQLHESIKEEAEDQYIKAMECVDE